MTERMEAGEVVLIDLTGTTPPSNNNSLAVAAKQAAPVAFTTTSSSSSSNSNSNSRSRSLTNPYAKKKFVGGAEKARQNARKKAKSKGGTRILVPGAALKKDAQVLPKNVNGLERFFAALLRSPAADFLDAKTADSVWKASCARVGLTAPTSKIQARYDCAQTHFDVRAALVLEEARCSISSAMQAAWKRRQRKPTPMHLTAHVTEKSNAHGHTKITFSSTRNYTKDELKQIRPGSVFQVIPRDERTDISNAVLGVVLTGNAQQVEKKKCFCVLFFRPDDLPVHIDDTEFSVTPVAQCVSELRCFEATTQNPDSIAFLSQLLGKKGATHTRFDDEAQALVVEATAAKAVPNHEFHMSVQAGGSAFNLPKLNATQEQAASTYLNSEQNTITLVQGPPGTGKTTLLVSIICRYLMEAKEQNKDYRLMVSAPTNKAVTVLAKRFLAAVNKDQPCPFNCIMVGDKDKLLTEERSSMKSSDLQSIFLYSWIATVMEGYTRIRSFFLPRYTGNDTAPQLCRLALQLQTRITNSLPHLSKNILSWTDKITKALESLEAGGAAHGIIENVGKLLQELKEMPNDTVWSQLMLSANVIFCTLASAGGNVLKRTSRINDLIIDEAAASTEPELYIPFHLRPTRLLAVGDPLQLPATVLSQKAIGLGLPTSLHERLMYECNFEFCMLNVQYRMSPDISSFPSARFYNNQISNGPNVSSAQYLNGARLLDRLPYTFVQVDGLEEQAFGGSTCNKAEAKKIVELVVQLQQSARSNETWHSSERIRVITFYTAQVALIKRLLQQRGLGEKVTVATVDSSQGSEADTVLISFVRSQNSGPNSRHEPGFLKDNRRVNVALTRAKFQLVCVGNLKSFQCMTQAPTLGMLAANANERGVVHSPLAAGADVNSRLDLFYGAPPPPQNPSKKLKTER